MKNQNARVIVASERPDVRNFLEEIVEDEGGVTVGQAQDARKTLTLVKNLKPDVAIIDCYLPYVVSSHVLPLSRTSGLDIAQAITQETQGTKVVLVNNLDTVISPDRAVTSRDGVAYSIKTIEDNMPLVIRNIQRPAARPNSLVFANVEAKPQELLQRTGTSLSDKVVFFGACGIALGGLLMITWVSFYVGGAIALVGMTAFMVGIAGKLAASLWRGRTGRKP